MVRQIIPVDQTIFTIALDDQIPIANRNWAILKGRVIDEITQEPPKSPLFINTTVANLIPRAASDGLVGLVGIPRQVFPQLDTHSYSIQISVKSSGYLPLDYHDEIGPQINFPTIFQPLQIPEGALVLHRQPIVVSGRVVEDDGMTITPMTGVEVKITEIWRFLSDISSAGASESLNMISLQPPLYHSRKTGTDRLRRREMIAVPGEDKYLLENASNYQNRLYLSDRINLTPGNIIVIDETNPDLREFHTIDAISGSTIQNAPALVSLTLPLAYHHPIDAVVRKVTPQAPGGNKQLTRPAIPGDVAVHLNNLVGLATVGVVEIHGGSNPVEYHAIKHFSVTTNASGYFRLPPIHRVAQIKLEARKAAWTEEKFLTLNYIQRENRIDFKSLV